MSEIEANIEVFCHDGAVVTIPNPEYVLSLSRPAWVKRGMLYNAYKELKAHVATEGAVAPKQFFGEFGSRRWSLQLSAWIRGLDRAVLDELAAQVRRVTGKPGEIWDHDVILCLTTRCGLTYTEATNIGADERARLLSALPDHRGGEPVTPEIRSARAKNDARAKLEQAIGKLGEDAKAKQIIEEARVGEKLARDILRKLQEEGKYKGFARLRPKRYQ